MMGNGWHSALSSDIKWKFHPASNRWNCRDKIEFYTYMYNEGAQRVGDTADFFIHMLFQRSLIGFELEVTFGGCRLHCSDAVLSCLGLTLGASHSLPDSWPSYLRAC